MMHGSRSLKSLRSAFTLTEILVVIAIIAVLAGLATWGAIAMIGVQARRNTESTMKTVNKVLQDHWRFVIDEAKKDPISAGTHPALFTMAAPDATGERARVLWIKFRLAEAFPQNFEELSGNFVYSNDASGNPYIPVAQRRYILAYKAKTALAPAGPRVAANTQLVSAGSAQSAACLLIALSVNRGGTSLNEDAIRHAVADTDFDGVREIVDGWGKPIMFVRNATFPKVQAANPAIAGNRNANYADPTDPDGTLINMGWYNLPNGSPNPQRQLFETKISPVNPAAGGSLVFHPIMQSQGVAKYVVPAIISSGKDRVMALNFVDGSPIAGNPGELDNIYSFQLRLD